MNEIDMNDKILIFEKIEDEKIFSSSDSFYSNHSENIDINYPTKVKISLFSFDRKLIKSINIFGIFFDSNTYILLEKYLILENSIIISFDGILLSFDKGNFMLNWQKKSFTDIISFKLYENDLIIYDELEVARIDINGNDKWSFSGMDHFISYQGTENFIFCDEYIKMIDSNEVEYRISYDGEDINKINPNYFQEIKPPKENLLKRIIKNFR
ncbi:hypothetical protein [Flavobacterium sp.]|uniref:hypothetical protein n=1 Tax=Flavobacterium sp. TaxID=239 RepID=UPI0026084A42|nr:hypothetical protein [Flavobacterium sp.]